MDDIHDTFVQCAIICKPLIQYMRIVETTHRLHTLRRHRQMNKIYLYYNELTFEVRRSATLERFYSNVCPLRCCIQTIADKYE